MKKLMVIVSFLFILSGCDKIKSLFNTTTTTQTTTKLDKFKPVLIGVKDLQVNLGSQIDYLAGILAVDDTDGVITDQIKVDHSQVDLTKVGTYIVLYSVKDSANNMVEIQVELKVIDPIAELFTKTRSVIDTNRTNNDLSKKEMSMEVKILEETGLKSLVFIKGNTASVFIAQKELSSEDAIAIMDIVKTNQNVDIKVTIIYRELSKLIPLMDEFNFK